jgi:beta-lactam-binding protein with PASTA domain
MKSLCACAVALCSLAGCLPVASSSFSGGTPTGVPRASGASTEGMVTIPNLFGLTREQAEVELRRAGHQGSVVDGSSQCPSVLEGRVIELGQVCYQHPAAGQVQGARLPVSLHVQTQNPWHGDVGKPTEWRLMPNLVGMHVDQAREEMRRVGFTRDERVLIHWVDAPGCSPLTVCETYPAAMTRVGLESEKIISIGRDPNAPPKTVHSPDTSGPSNAPSDTSRTDAPKVEPTPEPFF